MIIERLDSGSTDIIKKGIKLLPVSFLFMSHPETIQKNNYRHTQKWMVLGPVSEFMNRANLDAIINIYKY